MTDEPAASFCKGIRSILTHFMKKLRRIQSYGIGRFAKEEGMRCELLRAVAFEHSCKDGGFGRVEPALEESSDFPRLVRKKRLEEHVDESIAAKPESPRGIVVCTGVISDDLWRRRDLNLLRMLGQIRLEASAAHDADWRSIPTNHHSSPNSAVAGSGDANDRCEHDGFRRVQKCLCD